MTVLRILGAPRRRAAHALARAVMLAGGVAVLCGAAQAQVAASHPGASVYKTAGCITCHKWHGMGGTGYGGTPVNFREIWLDRDQIVEVVACGRPGTAMPYHHRAAYAGYDCYEGMRLDELLPEDRPGKSRSILSTRQVRQVSQFILDHFAGRPNEPVAADCELFFGTSRMCRNLDRAMNAGGGGGH